MSKTKRTVAFIVSFAMVLGCMGMFAGDISQKLFQGNGTNKVVLDAVDENALGKTETPIADQDKFDYEQEEFVVDDTFRVQANYTSNVADVNDYELIESTDEECIKLTVQNSTDNANNAMIVFSEAGKNEFVLRDNYFLEYDVMMEGNDVGTGAIDIDVANGNIALADATYGYDLEGVLAVDGIDLSGHANNRWYARKIPIPEELSGHKIFRWKFVHKMTAPNALTTTYFKNIRITDAEGNTLLSVDPTEENLTCRAISKSGVNNYTVKMSKMPNVQVYPQGDYLRFMITSYELEEGASSYVNYAFSTEGRGNYVIKKGDVLVYKVKNINPFVKGSATVDIRFKDKTWLTDKEIADQNGKSIWPSTDLRAEAGGFWYYRAIEIPSEYVGKTVDYFTFKTLNTVAMADYEVQLADVKIINGNKTSLLVYGGGDVTTGGLAAIRNAELFAIRNHAASNQATPSGDYLRGQIFTYRSDNISANTEFSTEHYTIEEGDYLEYDITTFDDNMLNSGYGIDLELESGSSPSDYAWKDQSGLSAVPGMDITDQTSGLWYHRKIDLTDMAGEEIISWRLIAEINNGADVRVDGYNYTVGVDNIRITNSGKTVKDVYSDGLTKVSNTMRAKGCEYFLVAPSVYDAKKPVYQVLETKLDAVDAPVITYNVKDFGAKGDGKTDDTMAIQQALYAADEIGGGVVYAPSGNYVVKGHLYVPTGVQLRGDWQNPLKNKGFKGTVLMAYADRGTVDAPAFINCDLRGTLSHIAIWYPEQKADDIQPYPWTIQNQSGSFSVYNITLYNSYRGIKMGKGSSGTQMIENVYATVLSRGFELGCNFDLPRYHNIYFTPDTWANSGLNNAPSGNKLNTLKNYLINNLEGLRSGRIDGLSMYNINIDYAKYGIYFDDEAIIEPGTVSEAGAFSNLTKFNVTNTNIGFKLTDLTPMGLVASKGYINANQGTDPIGILIETFSSNIAFADSVVEGSGNNVVVTGNATYNFQNTSFHPGNNKDAMVLNNGILNMNGCDFTDAPKALNIGTGFIGGVANANIGMASVNDTRLKIDNTPQEFDVITDENATFDDRNQPLPGKNTVYNILDYGIIADGVKDTTEAIQKAIDEAAKDGGGIVYFPGGKYRIDGNIIIKSGVEIRGVHHTFHTTNAGRSIFEVYGGKGEKHASATFRLESNAGISGVTFYYPEQTGWNVSAFPWAIQSVGEGCWVANTSFVNAYRGIDFYTNNADKHYIAGISSSFIESGIFVGNSPTYGTLKNTHNVINQWDSYKDYGCVTQALNVFEQVSFIVSAENLISFKFGDCKNESSLSLFTWIANRGAVFTDQGDGGFKGNHINFGIDGPYISMDVIAAEEIIAVNPYLYLHGHNFYSSERAFLKSHKTNGGVVKYFNVLGHNNGFGTDNFLIYNGDILIQQFAADSAQFYNANIQGGNVKMVGIINRPCTMAYGGGKPTSLKVTRYVNKLDIIGWIDINRRASVVDEAGDRTQIYGMYSFNQ